MKTPNCHNPRVFGQCAARVDYLCVSVHLKYPSSLLGVCCSVLEHLSLQFRLWHFILGGCAFYPHFTDVETEALVGELMYPSRGAGLWTRASWSRVWALKPCIAQCHRKKIAPTPLYPLAQAEWGQRTRILSRELPSWINYLERFRGQRVGTERASFLELQSLDFRQPKQDILWALKTNPNDLIVQEYKGLID